MFQDIEVEGRCQYLPTCLPFVTYQMKHKTFNIIKHINETYIYPNSYLHWLTIHQTAKVLRIHKLVFFQYVLCSSELPTVKFYIFLFFWNLYL